MFLLRNDNDDNLFEKVKSKLKLLPIVISICLIPLLVRLKLVNTEHFDYIWSQKILFYPDFHFYYKSLVTQGMGFITLLYIFINLKSKKIELSQVKNHKAIVILLALCFFTILSFIFSENRYVSLWGMQGQMEGVFVYLSYFIIAIYTSIVVSNLDDFKTIIKYSMPFIILMTIIGISQMIGHNVFETNFGKILIASKKYINDIKYLNQNNQIYLTLANPNYVGSYMTLLVAIITQLFFCSKTKSKKVFYASIYIVFILILFSSGSRAGYIGVFISLTIWALLNLSVLLKNNGKKGSYYQIAFILFVFFLMLFVNGFKGDLSLTPEKRIDSLNNIITKTDEVFIEYKEKEYYVKKDKNNKYYLYDTSNDLKIKSPKGLNIQSAAFEMNNSIINGFILILNKDITWYFFDTKDGFKYLNSNNKLVDLKEVEYFNFKIDETLGSNRIYIWSRSIPLLKESLIIGHGPGMFTIKFPQTDYIGKFKYYGYGTNKTEAIIDKPHNTYLQYGIDLGVFSLLLYILLNLFLISKLFNIIRNGNLRIQKYVIPIFSLLIGYAIISIFNDSSLGVSTIYWTIIGLAMALINIDTRKDDIAIFDKDKILNLA